MTDRGKNSRRKNADVAHRQLNMADADQGSKGYSDAAGLLYGRDTTISLTDDTHVEKGCWALDTINAN